MLPSEARQYRDDIRDRCEKMGEPGVREALATNTFGTLRKRHIAEEWLHERDVAAARAQADAERGTDLQIAREANEIARAANDLAITAGKRAASANRIAIIAASIAVVSAAATLIPLFR